VFDTGTNATVPNATVTGSFAPGATGSCVTGSTGSCTLGSGNLSLSLPTTSFTVTGVSGTNMSYNSGANFPTQVTITR
jgi:aqualysin 1